MCVWRHLWITLNSKGNLFDLDAVVECDDGCWSDIVSREESFKLIFTSSFQKASSLQVVFTIWFIFYNGLAFSVWNCHLVQREEDDSVRVGQRDFRKDRVKADPMRSDPLSTDRNGIAMAEIVIG